jgi:8-oxo-dGTP diphosphatase
VAGTGPLHAAGGVVWRRSGSGIEIALVHRPKYDDWTLPKGKLASGEVELQAAVREVGEELGASVAVSRRIGRVRYLAEGVPKTVTYWAMRYAGGEFRPGPEVDAAVWLGPAKARKRLSYDVDRTVVRDFADVPPPESVVILVRHGRAGKRREWQGEDWLRPLDDVGQAQAHRLAALLGCFEPDRVIAAPPLRCVQTVQPLAAAVGVPVEVDPVFADDSYERSRSNTHNALAALLGKTHECTVICSQGITIPAVVERLGPGVRHPDTRKGAAWVLSAVDGEVVAADYYEASPTP